MQKSIRVPTQIHTRKLDRLVAHKNMERAGIKPEDVDEVVMGCVGQAAENAFMARFIACKIVVFPLLFSPTRTAKSPI